MKKYIITLVFLVFSLLFLQAFEVKAQMMGSFESTSSSADQLSQDETTGKALWQKFQAKEITCSNLTDEDFDHLGDFFMGSMMGTSSDIMNQIMTQRIGQDGEEQMHIAMGKRITGCDTNAVYPNGYEYFLPMMGGFGGMMGGYAYNANADQSGLYSMMGNLTNVNNTGIWIISFIFIGFLLVVFLFLGIVYFWKRINSSSK